MKEREENENRTDAENMKERKRNMYVDIQEDRLGSQQTDSEITERRNRMG